jgi:hypothetical protein
MRKPIALLLLLLLALAGCSRPVVDLHAPQPVTWNGNELTGARFYARTFPSVTVHYAPPSSPEEAELAGRYAQAFLDTAAEEDGCCPGRADIWLLPPGAPWPDSLPEPMSGLRAVGSGAIILRRIPTQQEFGRASDILQNWMGAHLRLALTEPAGSPVFAVDWLYQGMSAVLSADPARFPSNLWTNLSLPEDAIFATLQQPEATLAALQHPAPTLATYQSAAALAALLVDRYGLRWTSNYPRTPEELTPEKALLWATGTTDPDTAFKQMQARMSFMRGARPVRNGTVRRWIGTAADTSPLRFAPSLPALPAGPGPGPNRSPHGYTVKARLEPETRTVTGELTLQWQNGEGIPVDTLSFNLWPNAEQFVVQGASITIHKVIVNGQPAAYTARGLDLTVPINAAPGDEAQIHIAFTTRLAGAHLRTGPEGARLQLTHWYPTLAVLDDRGWNLTPLPDAFGRSYAEHAAYQVELDLPTDYALAATGTRIARTEDHTRVLYRYEAAALQDFTAVGGTSLTETVQPVGASTLRILTATPAAGASTAAAAQTAFAALQQKLGALPPGEIPLLEVNDPTWQTTLPTLLADRWFGEAVGSDRWGEPWLHQAFTLYAARSVQRQTGAPPAPIRLNEPFQAATTASTSEYLRYGSFSEGVAQRGALALESLEQQLGTAAFDRLLQGWAAEFRYRTATTADFVARVEQAAGTSLAPFWELWGIDPAQRAPYEPILPLGKMTLP